MQSGLNFARLGANLKSTNRSTVQMTEMAFMILDTCKCSKQRKSGSQYLQIDNKEKKTNYSVS